MADWKKDASGEREKRKEIERKAKEEEKREKQLSKNREWKKGLAKKQRSKPNKTYNLKRTPIKQKSKPTKSYKGVQMPPHTALYMNYFGYDLSDFVPSELTGKKSDDIHHIESRGMGGTKKQDTIENLQALTREEHLHFGDKKEFKEFLKMVHLEFLETKIPYIKSNPNCLILSKFLKE